MATHQIDILSLLLPDSSGSVYWTSFDQLAANDVWKGPVLAMVDGGATDVFAYGFFTVPQNYVGSAAFIPVWSSATITGNVVLGVEYRTVGGDDTASLDQSGSEEDVTVTDAAPTAAWRRLTPSIAPTAGNFSPGETVEFRLSLDGSNAACTIAATIAFFQLLFQYADA